MINLDSDLIDLLPWVNRRRGQRVGIELEYEGFSEGRFLKSAASVNRWYLERDPSLRAGGMELISQILQPGMVDGALDEAHTIIDGSGARAHARCGVHVHLNMTDVTVKHLWNLLVLYALAEPTIFKQFADGREFSHFCVPMWSNAVFAQTMYNDIKNIRAGIGKPKSRAKRHRPGDLVMDAQIIGGGGLGRNNHALGVFRCIKYTALNLRPLTTLGSIEFRQHPGTTDMRKVKRWVDFLMNLRDCAGKYKDPLDILDDYEENHLFGIQEQLGLDEHNVDEIDQEEAEDVATMAAGHIPAPWTDFTWEIK